MWLLVYVCVYDDASAVWQIWGCLMNICVVMCSGSRETFAGFGWIKYFLTKGQIYHHHWMMKKIKFFDLTCKYDRQK